MVILAPLLFSPWTFGALTVATAVAASWRGRPAMAVLGWALAACFVASRLLSPQLELNTLALAHSAVHLALLVVLAFVLGDTFTAPVLLLAGLTLVQFGLNLCTVLLFDPFTIGPRHEYDTAIAVLFSLQLACVWAARLRLGATRRASTTASANSLAPALSPLRTGVRAGRG